MRKIILIISGLSFITLISFGVFWPDQKLHIIACNVGQGDAILITQGFKQILVDGGPSDKVLGCLSRHIPFWDKNLDLVINTHPEADHLKGLIPVMENYQVSQLVINSIVMDTDLFRNFHDAVLADHIKVHSPRQGERIKLGQIELKVLWPSVVNGDLTLWRNPLPARFAVLGAATGQAPNESAIVLLANYGKFNALLTADAPEAVEKLILDYCGYIICPSHIEVLKVGHHGSKTSTTQELLDYFNPKDAIISVGKNSFGHPTQEVLDRLTNTGTKILRTDLLGDIVISTDGTSVW